MFDWLFSLFSWLTKLWEKVPDSTKEKIIAMIVETFEAGFREYYRSNKQNPREAHA